MSISVYFKNDYSAVQLNEMFNWMSEHYGYPISFKDAKGEVIKPQWRFIFSNTKDDYAGNDKNVIGIVVPDEEAELLLKLKFPIPTIARVFPLRNFFL